MSETEVFTIGGVRVTLLDCESLFSRWTYEQDSKKHLLAAFLARSIFDRTDSILLLIGNDKIDDAKILLRSLIEAEVDYFNNVRDADYWKSIYLEYLYSQKKTLKAHDLGNIFVTHRGGSIALKNVEGRILDEIKRIESEGTRILKKSDKFKLDGQSSVYWSIYQHLCDVSHNGLESMFLGTSPRAEELTPSEGPVLLTQNSKDIRFALSEVSRVLKRILELGVTKI